MRLSAISRSRPPPLDNPAPALYALAWIGVSRDHHQAEVDTMPTIPGSLRSTARRVPDAPALTFGGRTSTYAELDATVDQTACALAGLGLRPGDRFALMATNSDQFVVTFYAALRCGAIIVPVNPASAPPEIAYLLEDSEAAAFAFD